MKNSRQFIITKIAILTLIVSACGSNKDEVQNSLQIKNVAKVEYRDVPDNIRFNDTSTGGLDKDIEDSFEYLKFDYILPEGWSKLPKAQFKDVNISIDAEPRAICYLTTLPLKGGEILPNLNRWRGQFNLPPIENISNQESEPVIFLGKETILFKITGDYKPLAENGKNFISFNLIQSDENNAYSFKFLGPAEFVLKEKAHFLNFLMSLNVIKKEVGERKEYIKNLPLIPDKLQWEIPQGWVIADAKPQRVVTFKPKEKDGPECYIAIFGGDILDNLNRWRNQMKLTPVKNIDAKELINFSAPIGNGVVVFLEGNYSGGMSGQAIENAIMAGAIIKGTNKSVFVKMVGKKEDVLQEKESFLSLIKSLKGIEDGK